MFHSGGERRTVIQTSRHQIRQLAGNFLSFIKLASIMVWL